MSLDEDVEAPRAGLLASDGQGPMPFRKHLEIRCCGEWRIIRKRLFPEWAILAVIVLYWNIVGRYMGFIQHRQIVDYIPSTWCDALANSPTTGWKPGDSCLNHTDELLNHGILHDALIDALAPEGGLSHSVELVPEALESFMTVMIAGVAIWACVFRRPGPNGKARPYLCNLLTRMLRTLALAWGLRPFFFLGTSLPGPNPKCVGWQEELENRPHNWWASFYDLSQMGNNCGDLIYSGHMSALTVMVCIFFYYGREFCTPQLWLYYGGCIVCTAALVVQPFFIAAARNHYSVDMITAVLVSAMIFRLLVLELGPDLVPAQLLPVKEQPAEPEKFTDEAFAEHVGYRGSQAGGAVMAAIVVGFFGVVGFTFYSLLK